LGDSNGPDQIKWQMLQAVRLKSKELGRRGCMLKHAPRHTGFQGHKYPSSVPIPLISNFNSLSSLLLSRFFFLVFLLFSFFFLYSTKQKNKRNYVYTKKKKTEGIYLFVSDPDLWLWNWIRLLVRIWGRFDCGEVM